MKVGSHNRVQYSLAVGIVHDEERLHLRGRQRVSYTFITGSLIFSTVDGSGSKVWCNMGDPTRKHIHTHTNTARTEPKPFSFHC